MSPIIALSTCWLSHRHNDGYTMLKEVAEMGFEWVELSHGIRPFLVEGIRRAVNDKVVRILSVHNFCPLPSFVNQAAPNLYEPSHKDTRIRMLWFNYTQQTLEFARNVGAQYCILHGGSVPLFWRRPQSRLRRWRQHYSADTLEENSAYQKWLSRSMKQIKKNCPKSNDHLKESLKRIIPLARGQAIRIALENRDGLTELPLDEQFVDLLKDIGRADILGHWHDIGHSMIKEQTGIIKQKTLLEQLQDRLIGFHIHDVTAQGVDHQEIGKGCVDFSAIKSFFKEDIPLTLEMNPDVPSEGIARSRDYLDALFAV